MSGKFYEIFFFEKNISAEKCFFRKKKLKKNVLSTRSLANFLNRLKGTRARTVLDVRFLSRKSQKRWFTRCFATPKITAWATFVCSFFVDKMCCKNREKASPRLALLKCEWTLGNPWGTLPRSLCSRVCPSKRFTAKHLTPRSALLRSALPRSALLRSAKARNTKVPKR